MIIYQLCLILRKFRSHETPVISNVPILRPQMTYLYHGKDACDRHGMKFIIKMEDRFARSEQLQSDVEHNVRYIRNRSLPHTNIKLKKLKLPYGRYLLNFLKSTIKQYFQSYRHLPIVCTLENTKTIQRIFSNEVKLSQQVKVERPLITENFSVSVHQENLTFALEKKVGPVQKRDNYFTRNSYARDENGTPWA